MLKGTKSEIKQSKKQKESGNQKSSLISKSLMSKRNMKSSAEKVAKGASTTTVFNYKADVFICNRIDVFTFHFSPQKISFSAAQQSM